MKVQIEMEQSQQEFDAWKRKFWKFFADNYFWTQNQSEFHGWENSIWSTIWIL